MQIFKNDEQYSVLILGAHPIAIYENLILVITV